MNAAIFCFSGTGNTLKVAEEYAARLISSGHGAQVLKMENTDPGMDISGFDLIGIAYPVHAFGAPVIVEKFVKGLNNQPAKKRAFIIKTSGEPLKLNNASSGRIIRLLSRRNFEVTNEYHYVMPYNIMFRHSDNMAYKMWRTAKALVPVHLNEILSGTPSKLKPPFLGRLVSAVMRIEHWGGRFNGKRYKTESNCIKCGKCVKNCPAGNIGLKDGKIVFGGNCLMCMRCAFYCPQNAVKTGLFNGWKVNGAYDFDNFNENEVQTHEKFCRKAYKRYFEQSEKKIEEYKANSLK